MSSSHVKYPSHTNDYDTKSVGYITRNNPAAVLDTFQITEKIHGTNAGIIVNPLADIQFASRNHLLGEGADNMGFKAHVMANFHVYGGLIQDLQVIANERDTQIQIYGEYFGTGILKMQYGEKQVRFFDIRFGNKMITKTSFNQIVPSELAVPLYATGLSFEDAMACDIKTQTQIGTGLIEGVVISPENDAYELGSNQPRFNIKKKNEEFVEKKSRVKKEVETRLVSLRADFMQYINEARVDSVLSKEHEFTQKDFGRVIQLVIADAKIDFLKEEGVGTLTKSDERYIYNAGGVVAPILKQRL